MITWWKLLSSSTICRRIGVRGQKLPHDEGARGRCSDIESKKRLLEKEKNKFSVNGTNCPSRDEFLPSAPMAMCGMSRKGECRYWNVCGLFFRDRLVDFSLITFFNLRPDWQTFR
jgi:hypothetical protein